MTRLAFLSVDTFFMLLLPLARAMRVRTGKDYLLYVMAICCGGTVTHSLIAPHPGLLAIAQTLKIDLGITIIAGIFVRLLQHGVRCLLPFVGRRPGVPPVRSIAEKLSAARCDRKASRISRDEPLALGRQ